LAGQNSVAWIRDYWPPARRAYASESSLQGVAYLIYVEFILSLSKELGTGFVVARDSPKTSKVPGGAVGIGMPKIGANS